MGISEGRLKKRAVSPVIATIILVAVAITVSVAVAYWMGDIASQYTKFESAKIVSIDYTSNHTITVKIKNIGTTLMNITEVMVGDDTKPFNGTCIIEKDKETTLIIFNAEWTSGQKYQITILTSIENRYVKKTIAP